MPKPSLWQGIADTLTADLSSGHYKTGDKLPTEAVLSARFEVNRHTIRRAIASLCDAGHLHARRGSGVFVTARPTPYPIGKRVRFHENIHADGHSAAKRVLHLETRWPGRAERAALKLGPGDQVHAYKGLSLADDVPLAFFVNVFPAARFPGLLEALGKDSSVTSALRMCGLDDFVRAETRVIATAATPLQANHLACKPGAVLLRTTGVNADMDGVPIEFGQAWFAGDRVELLLRPDG